MTKRTAEIKTPLSKDDPDRVGVEEIPLPPEAMWSDLDNSGEPSPESERAPTAASDRAPSRLPRAIASLDFVGEIFRDVPLSWPFRLNERTIDTITVRRLSVGAVGDLIDRRSGDEPDNFDIYAAMTGLPADVLRGLEFEDGERVTETCFDFLPHIFRPRPAPAEDASE